MPFAIVRAMPSAADRLIADMRNGYDSLGPLARAAVRVSPIEIDVGPMLAAWRRANPEIISRDEAWSLLDPAIDASVAVFVESAVQAKTGKPLEAFRVERRHGCVETRRDVRVMRRA